MKLRNGSACSIIGERHGLEVEILEDDIERTALIPRPDLLLATLVLEHIDWPRRVEAFVRMRPRTCGIVLRGLDFLPDI